MLVVFAIICSASKINGQTTSDAEQIAVSMYLPVKSLLELNEADYNLCIQTMKQTDITDEQKYDILKVNPNILNYLTSCSTAVKNLDLLNAQSFYSNPENRKEIMKYFDVQLGFEPKQLDCEAYEGQAYNCNAQYVACGIAGYMGCLGTTIFYPLCAGGVFASCTALLAGCHTANNASYPQCAKLAGRGEFWKNIQNPWLIPVTLPYPPSADQD